MAKAKEGARHADYIPTHAAMKLRHGWGTRASVRRQQQGQKPGAREGAEKVHLRPEQREPGAKAH